MTATAVLTFEDCLGLCELSEEEIRGIAEHEHLPEIIALELCNCLMTRAGWGFPSRTLK